MEDIMEVRDCIELRDECGLIYVTSDFAEIKVVEIVKGSIVDMDCVHEEIGIWKPLQGLRKEIVMEKLNG